MSISASILNILLRPVGFLYGMGACFRRRLYSLFGLRSTVEIPAWVIGNLSVGGSGKTPLVIKLVQRLCKSG
ncbi:MAG: tetraacyldisaccharide 4'-kinase, partial [Sediminibacterium sp.]|nr:tetraacyldisaccharide 4'-kinase [Sediminibacterium sp.]